MNTGLLDDALSTLVSTLSATLQTLELVRVRLPTSDDIRNLLDEHFGVSSKSLNAPIYMEQLRRIAFSDCTNEFHWMQHFETSQLDHFEIISTGSTSRLPSARDIASLPKITHFPMLSQIILRRTFASPSEHQVYSTPQIQAEHLHLQEYCKERQINLELITSVKPEVKRVEDYNIEPTRCTSTVEPTGSCSLHQDDTEESDASDSE